MERSRIKEQFETGSIYFTLIVLLSASIIAIIPIVSMVAATLAVHQLIDLKKSHPENRNI